MKKLVNFQPDTFFYLSSSGFINNKAKRLQPQDRLSAKDPKGDFGKVKSLKKLKFQNWLEEEDEEETLIEIQDRLIQRLLESKTY